MVDFRDNTKLFTKSDPKCTWTERPGLAGAEHDLVLAAPEQLIARKEMDDDGTKSKTSPKGKQHKSNNPRQNDNVVWWVVGSVVNVASFVRPIRAGGALVSGAFVGL